MHGMVISGELVVGFEDQESAGSENRRGVVWRAGLLSLSTDDNSMMGHCLFLETLVVQTEVRGREPWRESWERMKAEPDA